MVKFEEEWKKEHPYQLFQLKFGTLPQYSSATMNFGMVSVGAPAKITEVRMSNPSFSIVSGTGAPGTVAGCWNVVVEPSTSGRGTFDGTVVVEIQDQVLKYGVASKISAPDWAAAVVGGAGTGDYATGSAVSIEAQPGQGEIFDHWEITPQVQFTQGGLNTPSATFAMPDQGVTARAVYRLLRITQQPQDCLLYTSCTIPRCPPSGPQTAAAATKVFSGTASSCIVYTC